MAQVFVIRPVGAKRDPSGRKIDFDRVQKELIGPVLESAQIGSAATGDLVEAGYVREEVGAALLSADLVICDITLQDANVFYALGIRQALRRRRTILIKGQPTDDTNAFEHLHIPHVLYDVGSPAAAKDRLLEAVRSAFQGETRTDSPLFHMASELAELDAAKFEPVPADFGAEVERACTGKAKGWLRQLSQEVTGRRFQLSAQLQLARAQLALQDWPGAQRTWEAVRDNVADHLEANLALAHIYAHRYSQELRADLLERSDQALFRVIKSDKASRKQLTEAMELAGQNQRSRWRLQFDSASDVTQRRSIAMNRALLNSFEHYRDAYFQDLSQFQPGLSALQMGTVLVDLGREEIWFNAFDTDADADTYKRRLDEQMRALRCMVPISLDAELQRVPKDDPQRLWAEICSAEILFLTTDGRDQRVVSAYLHAVPVDKPPAWETVRRRLELFVALGVRAELAEKVLVALAARSGGNTRPGPAQTDRCQHHVVLVAAAADEQGGRSSPAAPGGDANVRALLAGVLSEFANETLRASLYAAGNPGVAVIAHEVAQDLGYSRYVCIPENKDDYIVRAFGGAGDRQVRFNEICREAGLLELNTDLGLPRWLQGSAADPVERYCRWLLQLCIAHGAERTTLVVVGDQHARGPYDLDLARLQLVAREYDSIEVVRLGTQESNQQIA